MVQRKEKRPELFSELKMTLPAVLTPRSSLRFTFHNIEIKNGQYKPVAFAFAALPLFRSGRLIEDGRHVLELHTQMGATDTEVRGHQGELKKVLVVFCFVWMSFRCSV